MRSVVFSFTYLVDNDGAVEKAMEKFRADLLKAGMGVKKTAVKRVLPNERIATYAVKG